MQSTDFAGAFDLRDAAGGVDSDDPTDGHLNVWMQHLCERYRGRGARAGSDLVQSNPLLEL
ncbi:hypothetical protein GCM10011313_11710 [Mycetocola zhadangensis]|nr:hypothetical protein GCM10011313_11710 [Mycetocola zhadangensis]